jgi:hypothetical protein
MGLAHEVLLLGAPYQIRHIHSQRVMVDVVSRQERLGCCTERKDRQRIMVLCRVRKGSLIGQGMVAL